MKLSDLHRPSPFIVKGHVVGGLTGIGNAGCKSKGVLSILRSHQATPLPEARSAWSGAIEKGLCASHGGAPKDSESSLDPASLDCGAAPAGNRKETVKRLRHKSILIVDDDSSMLHSLDKVLTGEGAVVTCVASAEAAVEVLTKRPARVDLVITDLWMPFATGTGMTVIYVVREIFPSLPVIVLTAFGSTEVQAECLRQGAAAVLEKPVDTPGILAAIEGVLASQKNISGSNLAEQK